MLDAIHPKYTLTVNPKYGTAYNPVHDEVNGATATIIDLTVGERGWLAYKLYDVFGTECWHRLHTSIVENVMVDEDGNVVLVTRNTNYILNKIT